MSTINIFQISLEIWGIILSFVLAIFSSSAVYRAGGALKNIWKILLLNCMLLSCDTLAYVYRGVTSSVGVVMTRISNFGVFVIEGILVWMFAYLIQQILYGKKKVSLKSLPMIITTVCVLLQMLGTVLTPFTGLYYHFDRMNYYVRGKFVFMSFILLGAVLAVCIAQIYRQRKKLSEKMWHTFIALAIIISVSIIAQFIFYGISLINTAITLVIMVLFVNLLLDNRNKEFQHHIKGMEAIISELNVANGKERQR